MPASARKPITYPGPLDLRCPGIIDATWWLPSSADADDGEARLHGRLSDAAAHKAIAAENDELGWARIPAPCCGALCLHMYSYSPIAEVVPDRGACCWRLSMTGCSLLYIESDSISNGSDGDSCCQTTSWMQLSSTRLCARSTSAGGGAACTARLCGVKFKTARA